VKNMPNQPGQPEYKDKSKQNAPSNIQSAGKSCVRDNKGKPQSEKMNNVDIVIKEEGCCSTQKSV
jgi:hypothetical protein